MSTTPETTAPKTAAKPHPLVQAKVEIVNRTEEAIADFVKNRQLILPPDYSVGNAMRSAWLILQDIKDRNNRPALEVVTKASAANALLSMAVQGLDPVKKQCYFIVYGDQLVCQRGYFGDMVLAKRVMPGISFSYQCFYEGDEIGYTIVDGEYRDITHKQQLANVKSDKVAGAYVVIKDAEGQVVATHLMTIDRIRKSWGQSKTYNPNNANSTHVAFAEDMALRTVVRRACKPIINSSTDRFLVDFVAQREAEFVEAEVADEAAELANSEMLELGVTETPTTQVVGAAPAEAVPADPVAKTEAPATTGTLLGDQEEEF